MTITENSLTMLTKRECQIARLLSQGLSNKGIRRSRNITDGTIKAHLHDVFPLLGISSRTVLATFAQRSSGSSEEEACAPPVWMSAVRLMVIPNRTNCHGPDIRLVSHFIGVN